MRLSLRKRYGLVVLSLGLLLFGFQNCSQVNFVPNKSQSLAVGEEGQGVPTPPGEGDEEIPVAPPSDDDIEDYKAECKRINENMESRAVLFPPGYDLSGARGSTLIKSEGLGSLNDIRGNLRVLALKQKASARLLSNSGGNMIFCGMGILKVENSHGNLVVIGADVGDVVGYRGNLVVVGGQIKGQTQDVRGHIKIVP